MQHGNEEEEDERTTGLNESQLRAVVYPSASGGLQILAGPGSGKTHVLMRRVAYLIQHHRHDPSQIVLVTFTNKAALSMRSRLASLIPSALLAKLKMGTFHALCRSYLQSHGRMIGLSPNFIIADRDDSLGIMKRAIVASAVPPKLAKELGAKMMLDAVSRAKSKGDLDGYAGPEIWRKDAQTMTNPELKERKLVMANIFEAYDAELRSSSSLDFDDLLLYALQLFQSHPSLLSTITHVLVDEFQDTNSLQYTLLRHFSAASRALTIVGDPDQAIYGWRNASSENLGRMLREFEPCEQIFLEENYRSSGAILGAAMAVIRQDPSRINKSLKATHSTGSSLILHSAPNAYEEANFIASQIKHIVAYHGGLMTYGDVAILLRTASTSRNIELALNKAGIPSRFVGGHKFFSRVEVKDILSYLQLLDNPSYIPAFTRCLLRLKNIGESTVRALLATALAQKQSVFKICQRLVEGSGLVVKVNEGQKKAIKEFVKMILDLAGLADSGASVPDLIEGILIQTKYRAFLELTHGPDWMDRFDNIKELKAYAAMVALDHPHGITLVEEGKDANNISPQLTPTTSDALRTFLSVSMLATDTETEDSGNDQSDIPAKVILSTVHSFKGLEAPIVFIPAVEKGMYPFYRSTEANEVDEERRLLYVAITRAQVICYLTHAEKRMVGAEQSAKQVSPFVALASSTYPTLFVKKLQVINDAARAGAAAVLKREAISPLVVHEAIATHLASLPAASRVEVQQNNPYRPSPRDLHQDDSHDPYDYDDGMDDDIGARKADAASYTRGLIDTFKQKAIAIVPPNSGFSSALKVYRSTPIVAAAPTISSASASSSSALPSSTLTLKRSTITSSFSAPNRSQSTLSFAKISSTPTQSLQQKYSTQTEGVGSGVFSYQSATTSTSVFSHVPSSSFARSLSSAISSSSTTATSGVGSIAMPETRASVINDAVLLNPVVGNGLQRTNLESMQKMEKDGLEKLKRLGLPEDESEKESSSTKAATVPSNDAGRKRVSNAADRLPMEAKKGKTAI